jgi:sugar phosphate isomerase/epimerase
MFILSAFADEISPDPQEQVELLARCGVRHIELRSILKTNVLDLTDLQVKEFKSLLDHNGFHLSAIGSPIGKTKLDQPFPAVLARLERAIELCKVFETPNIRIFSYYLPEGGNWNDWRGEILQRMKAKTERAAVAGVRLLHENEHAIYGQSPARVRDIMQHVNSPSLRAVYDPANYVFGGFDPWDGWVQTHEFTAHFHIKDWVAGEMHGRVAGDGNGRIADVLADAVQRGYSGFATLEPHLLGGGPTGGVTGPELFPKAIDALKAILARLGAAYQ